MLELPGGFEWIIILAIVVLIFGVGRVGRIGGELGKGIREFRKGLQGDDGPKPDHDGPETKTDSDGTPPSSPG
jgi:sec-independent protein translocase protein TatA